MFALSFATLLFAATFVLDLSRLHLARLENQLVSDLAVLAAVNVPDAISGGTVSPTAIATARAVAMANGFDPARIKLTIAILPGYAAGTVLKATIAGDAPVPVGTPLPGSAATVPVASWARSSGSGICVRSHLGPINIYGDAQVDGPACGAEAKTYFHVCGKAEARLKSVTVGYRLANERAYLCKTASFSPAASVFTANAAVKDMIATSAPVTGMRARLDAMAHGWAFGTISLVRHVAPVGTDRTFDGVTEVISADSPIAHLTVSNATLHFSGNGAPDPDCHSPTTIAGTATMTGTNRLVFASGCYLFAAAFNVGEGSDTQFAVAPGASVVFLFNGTMTTASGSQLSLGDASIYFNGGSISNNGVRLSFGNGPFYLWGGTIYNVSQSSILSFGDGPFYFYGGSISNNGTMTLGRGPFRFSGGSLALNAGSTTSFGVGDMEFYGGSVIAGGDSVTFGAGGSASRGSGAVLMYGGSFALTARSLTAIATSFGFSGPGACPRPQALA